MRNEQEEDNLRVLRRVQAAIADPTGRLRLLVDGTYADTLPGSDIAQLRGTLRELDCSRSPRLRRLPMEIGHLHATLTALDCSHCALVELPEEVSLLQGLKRLDASHNRLTTFLWSCAPLRELATVNLAHNELRYLSPSAAQRLLLSTVHTDLRGNEASFRAMVQADSDTHAESLPPHVAACSVCERADPRGRVSRVYVQLLPWRPPAASSGAANAAADDASSRYDAAIPSAVPETRRVPVLHPCCGAECAVALFQWEAALRSAAAGGKSNNKPSSSGFM